MRKPITNLGKGWEYRHSLWMLWLFFPFGFLSFISFFVIGTKAKERRWIYAGFIYLALVIQFFFFVDYPEDHFLFEMATAIVLAQWIAACVHAASVRPVYLRKIAMIKHPELAQQAERRSGGSQKVTSSKPIQVNKYKSRKQRKKTLPRKPQVININKARQAEIAALPAFNNILAERVIQIRRKVGSFESMTHFIEVMNIKPHIIAKAKPYIVFSDSDLRKPNPKKEKSEVHKRKYSTGRIVDY